MKPAAYLILPLLAVTLAACGSSDSSQPQTAQKKRAEKTAQPVKQAAELQQRAAEPQKHRTQPRRSAAPKQTREVRPSSAKSPSAAKSDAKAPVSKTSAAAKKTIDSMSTQGLLITPQGFFPAGALVPAGRPIQLTITPADGKPHKVTVLTPTPKSLNVPAMKQARITLPALAKGDYAIEIDGRRSGTLSAFAAPPRA